MEEKIDTKNLDQVYDYLVDNGYFTDDELHLVTCIDGYNMEVLEDCIYARYGYRSLEQMLDAEKDNDDTCEN